MEYSQSTEECICEWCSVHECYNVRTLIPLCEWSTAKVQMSASVSGVVYMSIIMYVPQYPNVSGVQPVYRRVHL